MFARIQALVASGVQFIQGFTTAPIRGLCHGKVFTQADGTTDLSRVLGTVALLTYLFVQVWATVELKQTFDASAFGTGLAAVCGGVGIFILAHNYASR